MCIYLFATLAQIDPWTIPWNAGVVLCTHFRDVWWNWLQPGCKIQTERSLTLFMANAWNDQIWCHPTLMFHIVGRVDAITISLRRLPVQFWTWFLQTFSCVLMGQMTQLSCPSVKHVYLLGLLRNEIWVGCVGKPTFLLIYFWTRIPSQDLAVLFAIF